MWAEDAIFYHIYPLGLCAAPQRNDFITSPVERLNNLYAWIDHSQWLGANAWYLGPVFESESHGYDTVDYSSIDRRLGTDSTLANLSAELHRRGMRLVLDAVFNHVGRGHWAFRDVLKNGEQSAYRNWFANLQFYGNSPYGDPFTYEGWNGHYNLVKLNLCEPAVRDYLFSALRSWVDLYDIDGIRLDAADCLDHDFLIQLAQFCRHLKSDFWLMGEVVHGDYRAWANPQQLDAVTNYEAYKGLYSSLNSKNYFEIAYTLNRQFGAGGMYRDLFLYNFVDNHDVNRLASQLNDPAHLKLAYVLLFTMPGIPAIYYGSEFGVEGTKNNNDEALRPFLDLNTLRMTCPQPELLQMVHSLAEIRLSRPSLKHGDYREMVVKSQGLVFLRQNKADWALVALNAAEQPLSIEIALPGADGADLVDLLTPQDKLQITFGRLKLQLPANTASIIVPRL